MSSSQSIPAQVLQTLAAGGVVICSNARAARALSKLYGEQIGAAQGRRAWETPRITDWQQWLLSQWQQLLLTGHEDRTLLSPLQEEVLWNEIVRPAIEQRSLIAPAEMARLSASAYAQLTAYDGTSRLQTGTWDHASQEPELFRRWAIEFERRLKHDRWLCAAQLTWTITRAVQARILPAPRAVAWNGFDRLTPADNTLRAALSDAGCAQSEVEWNCDANQRLIALPSPQHEIEACALWAREQLSLHPEISIGILLPSVENTRAEIDRTFRRVLTPEHAPLADHEQPAAYEFTLGLPLADVPHIAAAVALLQWCVRPHEQEVITWIMTSGFFCRSREAQTLADADIRMRKKLSVPELEMDDALQRLERYATPKGGDYTVAYWVKQMKRARGVLAPYTDEKRSSNEWVTTIVSILKDASWPGDSTLDSTGFQALERWQRALDDMARLSFQERRYTYSDFLAVLQAHLRTSIFSPESQGAPITISGIYESAGRSFDATWIMGMTDDAWPSAPHKQLLLPIWLQAELSMPGSSETQVRHFARAIITRIASTTDQLIFSYAAEGKEGEQRPSALLGYLDKEALHPATDKPALLLETIEDVMSIPWPGGRAAGGQEVLKSQSACPFQAFAGKRLGARELPPLEPGLDAAERGTIVHSVLDTFWAEQQNSDQLRSLVYDRSLRQSIERHVAAAFERHESAASTAWERSYLLLEKERVAILLERWLRYENTRTPFQVEQVEKKETIFVDGLELNVRMDRIDRIEADQSEDGRILIDYKTGILKPNPWEGDRPAEPQLPIYTVSGKVEALRDVLFAQIRSDNIRYFSAVDKSKPGIFPHNKPDKSAPQSREACFAELTAQWTESLRALSQEFQQGIATVTPRDYPSTCIHCDFPGLCRVAESHSEAVHSPLNTAEPAGIPGEAQ